MNERVLIVDDDQTIAELLRYNLLKENYLPLTASSGQEALDTVRRHTPDAVLLDIKMPELDGWDVCRILRASAEGRSVPIIMLSALSGEEARIRGLSLGADDYIAKPFSIRELLLKIRKQVNRQRTSRQLAAREEERDLSLRYMIHEVQNSLTVIGGFSRLGLGKEDAPQYLRTITAAADHAENLLQDASLLARLERTGESLPVEAIDLADTIEDAVEMFHQQLERKNIDLAIMNSARAMVRANKTAVKQVLVNLISNAVKYSRHGGKIRINCHERDQWAHISVHDEGIGIAEAELPRIFDKFYRASGSERAKGAGLGLYIVKRLTGAMGGAIIAESERGEGSTFTVSFPVENRRTQ